MILLGSHIITPLGNSVGTNLDRILVNESPSDSVRKIADDDSFVVRCMRCISKALQTVSMPADTSGVVLILSTTKGENLDIWTPAQQIADALHNPNLPIVVSNACTSGVCAQVVANRLISSGQYKAAIVVGCDFVTEFIRSGFEVLKALSPNPCRPFDANREGINLGEAVATMLFADEDWWLARQSEKQMYWHYEAGSIRNDANHITGPSRTGEGSYRCLQDVLAGTQPDEISAISLHGTGTLYNDEMESIALHRAGLSAVPANSLKGYFGHTLGAAGLLETILCLRALEEGIILPTKGFAEQGTTFPVAVSAQHRHLENTDNLQFIKLLSGFGGTNAAVRYKRCNL